MKAQRRHELQTNTLAQSLANLPEFWNKHGSKVLLVLIAIALVVVLVRYRISSSRQATVTAGDDLGTARTIISELQALYRPEPDQIATARAQLSSDARQAIEQVMASTDDPKILAEALVARGDLNWTLANQPELPGATTRPALRLEQEPAEYLAKAEEAYRQVLDRYPQQKSAVVAARFGLAAIAENRRDWDAAAKQYEAILADKDTLKVYQDQARARQDMLKDISQPVYIAQPSTQPEALTTNYVELGPTTAPTLIEPSTQPAQ